MSHTTNCYSPEWAEQPITLEALIAELKALPTAPRMPEVVCLMRDGVLDPGAAKLLELVGPCEVLERSYLLEGSAYLLTAPEACLIVCSDARLFVGALERAMR